mmetsp:Transcript_127287/g.271382  ORF Transcript_127287/g.271382 Transcript_127287/m.271382 type:complete len:384 (-) Transcript_127287:54-1205(-)
MTQVALSGCNTSESENAMRTHNARLLQCAEDMKGQGPAYFNNNLTASVIGKVRGFRPDTGALVTGVWYEENSGEVQYDNPGNEDFKYAKLVTINSGLMEVARSIISVALMASSLAARLPYCIDLLIEVMDNELGEDHRVYAIAYISIFGIAVVLWLATASVQTWYKFKSERFMGDLLRDGHSEKLAFAQVLLMHLFAIPVDVYSAPVALHPRKGAQGHAFFKLDGGQRVHLIGWDSYAYYQYMQQHGFLAVGTMNILTSVPLLALQFMLHRRHRISPIACCAAVSSIASCSHDVLRVARIVRWRRDIYQRLTATVGEGEFTGERSGSHDKKLLAAHRSLQELFGVEMSERVLAVEAKLKYSGSKTSIFKQGGQEETDGLLRTV